MALQADVQYVAYPVDGTAAWKVEHNTHRTDAAPVYTRPAEYNGWKVPEVLLSGHEAKIRQWEFEQSLERTKLLRPDLLK